MANENYNGTPVYSKKVEIVNFCCNNWKRKKDLCLCSEEKKYNLKKIKEQKKWTIEDKI